MNLVRGQSAGSANCLRMAPPLTVSDDEVDLAITVIDEALTTVTSELAVGRVGRGSRGYSGACARR